MEFNYLKLEVENSIALLTINRPDKLNALNEDTLNELYTAFEYLASNDQAGVVILTGAGEKSFVAGADIQELSSLSPQEGKEISRKGQELTQRMENFHKPIIAAVNGYALGGGLEIALGCHFRIASENALFGLPEVTLGVIPGYGGTQRLPRTVGKGKALEMILTGDKIDAQEALRIGLVNSVVPQEELLDIARKLAGKMLKNGPLALSFALEAVNRGMEMNVLEGLKTEADLFGICCTTEDMKEGTKAFLEKRKPDFKGA